MEKFSLNRLSIIAYHGTRRIVDNDAENNQSPPRVKYWSTNHEVSALYGHNVTRKQFSVSPTEVVHIHMQNYELAEVSSIMQRLEQTLIRAHVANEDQTAIVYGKAYTITAQARLVIVHDIVDVPNGMIQTDPLADKQVLQTLIGTYFGDVILEILL